MEEKQKKPLWKRILKGTLIFLSVYVIAYIYFLLRYVL